MRIKHILFVVFLTFAGVISDARDDIRSPEVTFSPDSISIGDQVRLIIKIVSPKDIVIDFPEIDDDMIEGIEPISSSHVDTVREKNAETVTLVKEYIVTSFDSGEYKFDRMPLISGSDTLYAGSDAVLKVSSPDIPDDFVPYDIKEPMSYPVDRLLTVLIILLIIAALTAGFVLISGRKKIEKIIPIKRPIKTPYEEAIEKLIKLKQSKLIDAGRFKDYHTELTDVVRTYIEKRTGFGALEKTSAEILDWLPGSEFDSPESETKLRDLFECADFVKFAKHIPVQVENEMSWQNARDFIELSRPVVLSESTGDDEQSKQTRQKPDAE